MREFNYDCRLRPRYIRCASGAPCAGFDEKWFGARGKYPIYGGGGFRLVYGHEWEQHLTTLDKLEAA